MNILNKRNLSFILFLFTSAFCSNAIAECNFSSSDYRDDLKNPGAINEINIEIHNSRKWASNGLAILSSRSKNIHPKYKDKLKSTISVIYDFGVCEYEATVRQSGDWKDHIALRSGGGLIASLDVKMKTGNVLNATRFKLLLPETRGGINEIAAASILQDLGFISPETFFVHGAINKTKVKFLFQENAEKELLERNRRREGPIFEGAEDMLWSYKKFENFFLESISLSRLTNKKWAKKGSTSLQISVSSYKELQSSYLQFSERSRKSNNNFLTLIIPNRKPHLNQFENYAVLLIAMNGAHALRPHNRKYYYNTFTRSFEPIYYDGNIVFQKTNKENIMSIDGLSQFLEKMDIDFINKTINKLNTLENNNIFIQAFSNKSRLKISDGRTLMRSIISDITHNLVQLRKAAADIKTDDQADKPFNLTELTRRFNEDAKRKGVEIDVAELSIDTAKRAQAGSFSGTIKGPDGNHKQVVMTAAEVVELIGESRYHDRRTVLLPQAMPSVNAEYNLQPFADGELLSSEGVIIEIDHKNRRLKFQQKTPIDWILIRGANLVDWEIEFRGLEPQPKFRSEQRFNKFGLTGCLNFYGTSFSNVQISMIDGQCEDSVNIVSSTGHLDELKVLSALSDAVDIDFSTITIKRLIVDAAGNDCFDVSGGIYNLQTAKLHDCGDKGISVGESSELVGKDIAITNVLIGISSKDHSMTKIINFSGGQLKTCAEAFQKKQEFGGGVLKIQDFKCRGATLADDASTMILNGVQQ